MDLLSGIIKAINMLAEGDPLLRRGIERDWVCVINPALVTPIKELEKTLTAFPTGDLNWITGRETWILNSADPKRVQYMTKEMMFKTYAKEFEAQARLAAMRKSEEQDE